MLRISGLTKTFGPVRALDDVSLDVPAGQIVGVIGRSGAGKSTMLRLINRLSEPSAGTVAFEGTDVTALRGKELRAWRARCAMIFQQFNLVDRLDVMTNVLLGRANHVSPALAMLKLWSAQDRAMAMTALEMFDMGRLAAQRSGTLSGGQQQRVAICRALVQQPDVILADEPVASLDPRNTRLVMDALRTINREFGITVLVNLHSLDLARHYCDRLVGLAAGRLVFDGPPVALTDAVSRELYGLEADEVTDAETAADPRVTPLPARRALGAH
jgi:phosphonate transport system ATP-binding protein